MKPTLTLEISPILTTLTKALNRVNKDATASLSASLTEPINNAKKLLTQDLTTKPLADVKILRQQLNSALKAKVNLDIEAACNKIDGLKYQILGIGASIYGFFRGPISAAMDFEASMSNVKKVVDFTNSEDLAKFQSQIWQLTKQIPLTAKELTDIVASGGELGLDKKLLIPFTSLVAKMATAFNMSTEQAGNSIASLMKKMDIGIDKVGLLGDAINYLGANSAASPKEVIDILGRIGGLSRTIGLSALETSGLAASFANMKIPSEQAATAINKMLNTLGNATGGTTKFKEALELIGIDDIELQVNMSKSPLQAINSVLSAISTLDNTRKIGVLKDLFGEEAAPKIAQITSNMKEYNRIISITAGNSFTGSMFREFREISSTTTNQLTLLKNSITALAASFGQIFLPILSSAMRHLVSFFDFITSLIENHRTLTITIAGLVGGLFMLKAAFLAFQTVGAIITCVLAPMKLIFIAIGSAARLASMGVAILSTSIKTLAFSAGGILALFTAITTAIYLIYTNWDKISKFFISTIKSIKTFISSLINSISFLPNSISSITSKVSSIYDKFKSFIGIGESDINLKGSIDTAISASQASKSQMLNDIANTNTNIVDNKVINISTTANATEVAAAISANSYLDQ